MLNFVLGRACTGKSYYIVNKAAQRSLSAKAVIIVPEQFSFETERAVLRAKDYNSDNIQVMSFTKLYSEVSRLSGFGKLPVMSDAERILMCDLALKKSLDQLEIFGRFANYSDFCQKIATLIEDFKFAAVSCEEIMEASRKIGGTTGAKLHDIAVIMSVYESIISDKFIDPSDYLTRLNTILDDFDYFDGKAVFFDSFSGFTGQQFKIIEKILLKAEEVTFSFCTDNISNTELGVFYNINKTAQKIISIAEKLSVQIGETKILGENFYSNTTLRNLESFFVGDINEIEKSDDKENLNIISCKDRREEAFAACGIVKGLVEDQDYRYRDFIIVARNAADYEGYIELFCKKNQIPCFFDKKVPITDTLLYTYIKSLLQIKQSFSIENILAWLKCGMNDYDANELYLLEDYIYIWNISGADWGKEWTMNPAGLEISEIKQEEQEQLNTLNRLRSDIYTRLTHFCASFCGNAQSRSECIYNFLKKEKIDERLSDMCLRFDSEGRGFTASVLRQSWDKIADILDSLARLFCDEISTDEFVKAFSVSCQITSVSNIPQMLDEVTFGSADRIRPSKPRVAIILGANQGVFPSVSDQKGILATTDKRRLEEHGISLNDDEIKSAVEENYLVYSMLCCPVDKTFVLYSERTPSGAAAEPSAFISAVCESLENVHIENYAPLSRDIFLPRTKASALDMMSDVYGSEFLTVKESVADDRDLEAVLSVFDKKDYADSFMISRENSDALFNKNIYISASKLDNFYSCRLMYFLKYGLKTGKLVAADLNVMQRGTVTHYVLENLINTHKKGFCELSDSQISSQVDELINKYISSVSGYEILVTPRFKFLLSRISQSVKAVAFHLAEEFRQSEFEPSYCELEISADGQVPELRLNVEGGQMVLTGKIDRLDTFGNVIRVVDYKTGSKSFELSDTLFGLNIQMLIYLYAIVKNGKDIVGDAKAGGILYMPAKSSLLNESLAMNGLILKDSDVIAAMEKENNGQFIPKYKDTASSFIDEEMFDLIFKNIEKLICSMGGAIRSGDFKPEPVDGVKSDACKYCDYASVCRKKDSEHFKISKRTNEEIREILKEGTGLEL